MSSFDRVADIYDATRSLPMEEMNSIIDSITSMLGECKTIIDAGIGTGRFALPLSQRGYSVAGVDLSRKMMTVARQKGIGDLFLADIQGNLPFKDNSFDAALVVHVLHLIDDWRSVMHEIARVSTMFVLTVFTETEGIEPIDRYVALRRDFLFPLGRDRNAWKSALKKATVQQIYEQKEEISGDEIILYLENRKSSATWEVPDRIHERIMAQLRSELQGKHFLRKAIMKIAIWKSRQILEV